MSLLISKITFDKKPLEIDIYYDNEKIYSDTVNGEGILNRVYKLDENKKGNYSVVLKNNGRKYVREFKF